MNAKEKAIELYNNFRNENPVTAANFRAKRQAILCAKEILKALSFLSSDDILVKYWNEVKKEIELL